MEAYLLPTLREVENTARAWASSQARARGGQAGGGRGDWAIL